MLTGKRAAQEGRAPLESALLDSIVRGCLEQAPEDRWQTARDIRRTMTLPGTARSETQPDVAMGCRDRARACSEQGCFSASGLVARQPLPKW